MQRFRWRAVFGGDANRSTSPPPAPAGPSDTSTRELSSLSEVETLTTDGSFPRFNDLPGELRREVWLHAVAPLDLSGTCLTRMVCRIPFLICETTNGKKVISLDTRLFSHIPYSMTDLPDDPVVDAVYRHIRSQHDLFPAPVLRNLCLRRPDMTQDALMLDIACLTKYSNLLWRRRTPPDAPILYGISSGIASGTTFPQTADFPICRAALDLAIIMDPYWSNRPSQNPTSLSKLGQIVMSLQSLHTLYVIRYYDRSLVPTPAESGGRPTRWELYQVGTPYVTTQWDEESQEFTVDMDGFKYCSDERLYESDFVESMLFQLLARLRLLPNGGLTAEGFRIVPAIAVCK